MNYQDYSYNNTLGTYGNNNAYIQPISAIDRDMAEIKAKLAQYEKGGQPQTPVAQLQTASIIDYRNSDRYNMIIGKHLKSLLDNPMVMQAVQYIGFGQQFQAMGQEVQQDYINYEKEINLRNKAEYDRQIQIQVEQQMQKQQSVPQQQVQNKPIVQTQGAVYQQPVQVQPMAQQIPQQQMVQQITQQVQQAQIPQQASQSYNQ